MNVFVCPPYLAVQLTTYRKVTQAKATGLKTRCLIFLTWRRSAIINHRFSCSPFSLSPSFSFPRLSFLLCPCPFTAEKPWGPKVMCHQFDKVWMFSTVINAGLNVLYVYSMYVQSFKMFMLPLSQTFTHVETLSNAAVVIRIAARTHAGIQRFCFAPIDRYGNLSLKRVGKKVIFCNYSVSNVAIWCRPYSLIISLCGILFHSQRKISSTKQLLPRLARDHLLYLVLHWNPTTKQMVKHRQTLTLTSFTGNTLYDNVPNVTFVRHLQMHSWSFVKYLSTLFLH